MHKFEEVCRLSCEQWVDSFPAKPPRHTFSSGFTENMRPLLQPAASVKKEKRRRLSKKTIQILLVAAVLLAIAIATTAIAVPIARDARVIQLPNHGEYEVIDPKNAPDVDGLTVGYVPDGFVQTEAYEYLNVYENGNQSFMVEKAELSTWISFDTEDYPSETIIINGVKGVFYCSDADSKGIIFNNGEYIFMVDGNISKEELVKIAQNVQ